MSHIISRDYDKQGPRQKATGSLFFTSVNPRETMGDHTYLYSTSDNVGSQYEVCLLFYTNKLSSISDPKPSYLNRACGVTLYSIHGCLKNTI